MEVRVGRVFSEECEVGMGTPQGSVISPLLFSVMIDDIFNGVEPGVGRSLFADDGSLWKRGHNVKYLVGKVQEAIGCVERWARRWECRFSVAKTKAVFFGKKRWRCLRFWGCGLMG